MKAAVRSDNRTAGCIEVITQQYTRPSVNFSCLFFRKVDFLAKDNRKKSGPCALQCLARSVGNSVRSQVVDDTVSM